MEIKVVLALILSTMASLRMLFWLIKPKSHRGLALGLYDAKKVAVKRIFYFGLFLLLSYLIISKGSVVDFVIAIFAIGALYDFLFTYFRYPKLTEIKNIEENKYNAIEIPVLEPVRFYIAVPLILITLWLYWSVFVK